MAGATGGRLAAPAWARTMLRVYANRATPSPWRAPDEVFEALVDPASGAVLAEGCRPVDGETYRELFLRGKTKDAVCPDRGQVLLAEARPFPSGDDEGSESDLWPEDLPGRSQPPPPPEWEEAEWSRRRAEEWRRTRRERAERDEERWREWRKERQERRKEAEKAWREARKEEERRRKEWRKQMKRSPRHEHGH
jgi:hypothetical protein